MMNDEFKMIWKKAVVAYSMYYPGIFLRVEENNENPQSG
jgi:hypothetical protein